MGWISRLRGRRSGNPIRIALAQGCYGLIVAAVLVGLIGSCADAQSPRPSISQSAKDTAVQIMIGHIHVRHAAVIVERGTVYMALIIRDSARMTEEEARDLLESFARHLARLVAREDDDLDAPTGDSLGPLWDHYRLEVGAAREREFRGGELTRSTSLAFDVKRPSAAVIRWD